MQQDEEWGPFIEHDGRGWPVKVGQYVHVIFADGDQVVETAVTDGTGWYWAECDAVGCPDWKIVRYRVKIPRALAELRALIADLPVSVPA